MLLGQSICIGHLAYYLNNMDLDNIILLFVEDDLIDRIAFERYVKRGDFPYNYLFAESLNDAINLLDKERFDIVITDYHLGDGTAIDLIKQLKDIPFIVVTGAGDQELAVNAMKLGASDFITKDDEGNHLQTLAITVQNALIRNGQKVELENYKKNLESLVEKRTKELQDEIEIRKTKEQELKKRNDEIEKLIDELILALKKAEQSDKLKSAFLANMSHEVRTPLNAILGFSDLLDTTDFDPEKQEFYLNIIKSSGNQLLTIINDIIDVSKIQAGLVTLKNQRYNVNSILNELLHQFNNLKNEKGKDEVVIECNTALPDDESYLMVDEVRFRQILSNLLENAIKFTSKGKIEFGYTLEGSEIKFYVSDSGIGISEEKQRLIFERFRQVEESHTRQFGGTGLGLSIARGIVELFGGKIWLESKIDIGSTFYFTLPYDKGISEGKALDIEENDELPNWTNKTILITEDDSNNYFYLKEILIDTKANLIHAENGLEAIEEVKNNSNIDLILMDIRLPEMNGYDAIKIIREFNSTIPIITQTAYASKHDEKLCIEAGSNDYISKPINNKLLLKKIAKYIEIIKAT